MPSKWIVEDLKFCRPWLISLGPETAILVARHIEAEWDALQGAPGVLSKKLPTRV